MFALCPHQDAQASKPGTSPATGDDDKGCREGGEEEIPLTQDDPVEIEEDEEMVEGGGGGEPEKRKELTRRGFGRFRCPKAGSVAYVHAVDREITCSLLGS